MTRTTILAGGLLVVAAAVLGLYEACVIDRPITQLVITPLLAAAVVVVVLSLSEDRA